MKMPDIKRKVFGLKKIPLNHIFGENPTVLEERMFTDDIRRDIIQEKTGGARDFKQDF